MSSEMTSIGQLSRHLRNPVELPRAQRGYQMLLRQFEYPAVELRNTPRCESARNQLAQPHMAGIIHSEKRHHIMRVWTVCSGGRVILRLRSTDACCP